MPLFSSKKKEKKKASHYTQTGVSIPVNPYINSALIEFVPGPQTHVSLCGAVGGAHLEAKNRSTTQ